MMNTKKISLCMIAGNEEAAILHCLDSAKDAFDELCLVSAVGNQPADKTLYVVEKWCAENAKGFKGAHYFNTHDMPHVDDFGAARNLSFSLATGDWILWLDCDDQVDAINCARMREAVKVVEPSSEPSPIALAGVSWDEGQLQTDEPAKPINGIFATYRIEKQGAEILRERLIRRGFGRWKNAIHETCVVNGTSLNCAQIVVEHGDHKHKHQSSAARNAAILRRTVEDAPRHYFYLHTELKMLNDPECAKYARAALALLDEDQVEERYIILLNLSELDPPKRDTHLHEAARLQPHRREAFAYLCKSALIDGRTSDAISYFRIMDTLPLPSPLPWTHQGIWYGWARHALRIDVLRATGHAEQADQEHAAHMAPVGDWTHDGQREAFRVEDGAADRERAAAEAAAEYAEGIKTWNKPIQSQPALTEAKKS